MEVMQKIVVILGCLVLLGFVINTTGMATYKIDLFFGESSGPVSSESDYVPEESVQQVTRGDVLSSGQGFRVPEVEGGIPPGVNVVCSEWGFCENGIQRRTCLVSDYDSKIMDKIDKTRFCKGCEENWKCTWGKCVNGFLEYGCDDLNNCGTERDTPPKIKCVVESPGEVDLESGLDVGCVPEVQCDLWGSCSVEYDFAKLSRGVNSIQGIQTRNCYDKNSCLSNFYEKRDCYLSVDLNVEKINKCGQEYTAVYDRQSGELLSLVSGKTNEEGTELNIRLFSGPVVDNNECDNCFNGRQDSNEGGMDCGGVCKPCVIYNSEFVKQNASLKIYINQKRISWVVLFLIVVSIMLVSRKISKEMNKE